MPTAPIVSIVDDDKFVRDSMEALLRSLGYNVHTFTSAEELLETNLEATSCLIFDLHLTGLSGVELQELLIARGCRIPIIFVTAFPDERARNHTLNNGAIGFLSKPVHDEQLTKCLDLALATRIY